MGYQLYCEAPVASIVLLGASAVQTPSGQTASRSASCWNIRMAFGCTGFDPAPPPTGWVGERSPRANPSCNHSVVTPTHAPAAFRYSTRNQPSTRFHGPAAGHGDPVGGPTHAPSDAVFAMASLVVPSAAPPTPFTATPKP